VGTADLWWPKKPCIRYRLGLHFKIRVGLLRTELAFRVKVRVIKVSRRTDD